ncbi:hypothetical protein ACU8KH_05539 [Lachancea thermotolerans]
MHFHAPVNAEICIMQCLGNVPTIVDRFLQKFFFTLTKIFQNLEVKFNGLEEWFKVAAKKGTLRQTHISGEPTTTEQRHSSERRDFSRKERSTSLSSGQCTVSGNTGVRARRSFKQEKSTQRIAEVRQHSSAQSQQSGP